MTWLNSNHSCANPAYSAGELAYQLSITKAFVVIVHPSSLRTALEATRQSGVAADHIILIDELKSKSPVPFPTISNLVKDGLSEPLSFKERRLSPGEGKTKVAFLSFSSGTTGKPKVFNNSRCFHLQSCFVLTSFDQAVAISHSSIIAQVLQQATANRINEEHTSWDKKRFRPGDITLGGMY